MESTAVLAAPGPGTALGSRERGDVQDEGLAAPGASTLSVHLEPDPEHLAALLVIVPGEPIPQPRPRVTFKTGYAQAYVPKEHPIHAYRDMVALHLRVAAARQKKMFAALPFVRHAVELDVCFSFQVASRSATGRLKTTRPDIDNLLKAVLDAIVESGLVNDDNVIADVRARKRARLGPPSTAITMIWWRN